MTWQDLVENQGFILELIINERRRVCRYDEEMEKPREVVSLIFHRKDAV
jgi:hypothetical protein